MKTNKALMPLTWRENAVLGGKWSYLSNRFGPGQDAYQFINPQGAR